MTDFELVGRLVLSFISGVLVGIERQWHHKTAGLKTNTLVTVGATAFGLISQLGFGPNTNPAQVAAGVVTGIGFIGAGVIMRRGGSVQGINSAATLWATASIGLAIGAGYYRLACLVLAVVLATQFSLRWAANWIDKRSGLIVPHVTYHLIVRSAPSAVKGVQAVWTAFSQKPGISIYQYNETQTNGSESVVQVGFGLSEERAHELTALGQALGNIPGVSRAEWSKTTLEDEDEDRGHSSKGSPSRIISSG